MRLALILSLLLAVTASAASDMEQYRWKYRVLIIEAPSLDDEMYRTQAAALLAAWAGLIDRDLVILSEFGGETFSVALVGKDQREKLRRGDPLSSEELFTVIDEMPMRRGEVRSRKR